MTVLLWVWQGVYIIGLFFKEWVIGYHAWSDPMRELTVRNKEHRSICARLVLLQFPLRLHALRAKVDLRKANPAIALTISRSLTWCNLNCRHFWFRWIAYFCTHKQPITKIVATRHPQNILQVAQLWQRDRASSINDFRWVVNLRLL